MNTHSFAAAQPLSELVALARRQHAAGAGTVLDVLLRTAGCDEESISRQLLHEAGVEVARPGPCQADFQALDRATARQWRCVVLRTAQQHVPRLGMADPWDDALLLKASRRAGLALEPAAVSTQDLRQWLGEDGTEPGAHGPAAGEPAADAARAGAAQVRAEGPIVDFVDTAVSAAFDAGASDIHFECDRGGVTVKHRRDGVMAYFARLDGAQQAQEVISRIKVLAQLDITERRVPQDGRLRLPLRGAGAGVDLRVSIMPSVFGEDAVLRLLDKAQLRTRDASVSLDLLGFDAAHAGLIRALAAEPSGMLLVTGPTGSGKTTTVYAALSEINTGREKIITIEDPVEYELPGVLQIPVNERKGLTFAKGLRSILRHDPDRILVGEIRDAETAEIAVQSALTGHLVFSTVHANAMADIMGRFRHFGLDMFGFMSSLNGVVVQRLMRRLCADCAGRREAVAAERAWLARMAQPDATHVPRACGCERCQGTGYRGRFVIAEVHVVDDGLRDHVTEGAPLSVIKRHAYAQGVAPLGQQAACRVVEGQTTLEEVKRVVGWF